MAVSTISFFQCIHKERMVTENFVGKIYVRVRIRTKYKYIPRCWRQTDDDLLEKTDLNDVCHTTQRTVYVTSKSENIVFVPFARIIWLYAHCVRYAMCELLDREGKWIQMLLKIDNEFEIHSPIAVGCGCVCEWCVPVWRTLGKAKCIRTPVRVIKWNTKKEKHRHDRAMPTAGLSTRQTIYIFFIKYRKCLLNGM